MQSLLSALRRPAASHKLTYESGQKTLTGGPLMCMNMRAAVVLMSSDARDGVMIMFISLNPRSHSALLAGSVSKQRNRTAALGHWVFFPTVVLKVTEALYDRICW